MTQDRLLELIAEIIDKKAEAQTIEVKTAHIDCPEGIQDTLSSFSNQESGGTIVFGLDERSDFSPVGVYDVQKLQKKVQDKCENMVPPIRAVFSSVRYADVFIVACEIPACDYNLRPCYYRPAGRINGSYIRVGESDKKMTAYEVYSYDQYRNHVHDDERVIEKADISYMQKELIEDYIHRQKITHPRFSLLSDYQVNELTGLTNNGKFTLAAVLNFGIYPQGFLKQICITACVVDGYELGDVSESGDRFLDNRRIEGTVDEMLDEACGFCLKNMKKKIRISSITGKREDIDEYPLDAVREAILNALIHRDYSVYTEGTPISIIMFKDRMEIHSPGSLYGNFSVEDLGIVRPDLRNPSLASMAEIRLKTENRYTGIPTIRNAMKEAGLPKPEFINKRNEIVVILYNSEAETVVNNETDLLVYCKEPRTREEIAVFLGIGTVDYAVRKVIKPLLNEGKIKMTMPDVPRSKNQKYYSI